MKATFVHLTVLVLVLLPSTASADGLLRRLPADGSWVRYQWTFTRTEGAPQLAGTITISSVGTTTVADEKCRWLELKLIYDEQQSKHLWLMKLLIPEKHFKHGDDFMKQSVRMWFKVDDMGATEKPSLPKDTPEWIRNVSMKVGHLPYEISVARLV